MNKESDAQPQGPADRHGTPRRRGIPPTSGQPAPQPADAGPARTPDRERGHGAARRQPVPPQSGPRRVERTLSLDTPLDGPGRPGATTATATPTPSPRPARTRPAETPRSLQTWLRSNATELRHFGIGLAQTHGVVLGIMIVVGAIVALVEGFRFMPATIATQWMSTILAPFTLGGTTVGFTPLLPTLLILWFHTRRTRSALTSLPPSIKALRVCVLLNLAVPILLTLIAWFMVWDAGRVFSLDPPNLLEALLGTVLLYGSATMMGMGARMWRALLLRNGMPTWPVESFRLAGRFLLALLILGAALSLILLVLRFSVVLEAFAIADGLPGILGLTLISLLYAPNLALAGAAVIVGGEFHMGTGMVSLFSTVGIAWPPLPAFALLPDRPLPLGWLYLLLPALLAIAVVLRFVRGRRYMEAPVATAIGAGVVTAVVTWVIGHLSAGELGVFGRTGILAWLFALESALWISIPAVLIFLYLARVSPAGIEDIGQDLSAPVGSGTRTTGAAAATASTTSSASIASIPPIADAGSAPTTSAASDDPTAPETTASADAASAPTDSADTAEVGDASGGDASADAPSADDASPEAADSTDPSGSTSPAAPSAPAAPAEPKADADAEPKAGANAEAKADADAELKADADADAEPKADTDAAPTAGAPKTTRPDSSTEPEEEA